jgi:hypothetical protein
MEKPYVANRPAVFRNKNGNTAGCGSVTVPINQRRKARHTTRRNMLTMNIMSWFMNNGKEACRAQASAIQARQVSVTKNCTPAGRMYALYEITPAENPVKPVEEESLTQVRQAEAGGNAARCYASGSG